MIENLRKSYVSIGTIIKVKSSTKIKLVSDETIAQGCNFRPLQNLRNCFIQHSNISIRVAEPTHLLKFNFGKNMENWSQDLPKVIQTQAMHFHRCHPKDKVKISYSGVLSKWEIFIKMRAALLAPILPRVMKKGESKEGSSHFDENLSLW